MAVQFKTSGTVLFAASGSVAMDPACCCDGGVTVNCLDCDVPSELTVTFPPGWTNWLCEECEEILAATYVLTFQSASEAGCLWSYTSYDGCVTDIDLEFISYGDGTFRIDLYLTVGWIGGCMTGAYWKKTPLSCEDLTGTVYLLFQSEEESHSYYLCNPDSQCHLGIDEGGDPRATVTF